MAQRDYYKILNVDPKSTSKTIKTAYRQLALKYHPDHNPNNQKALEMFTLIKEAYDILSDPSARKNYDFTYTPSKVEPTVEPQKTSPKEATSASSKQKNLRYNLYITLEDVLNGCERTIRFIRKNNSENETIQLKVKVPKGAFNHQRLKLSGYGDITKLGNGDLFVIIHLQEHPIFLKNDLNLRVNVPVRYVDIAVGSLIEIPTLNGTRKIKLKPCEFDDLNVLLQGFGLPDPKGNYKGDLLVHFFIEHPKSLSTSEKNAMQNMQRTWPEGDMMRQYKSYLTQHKGSTL